MYTFCTYIKNAFSFQQVKRQRRYFWSSWFSQYLQYFNKNIMCSRDSLKEWFIVWLNLCIKFTFWNTVVNNSWYPRTFKCSHYNNKNKSVCKCILLMKSRIETREVALSWKYFLLLQRTSFQFPFSTLDSCELPVTPYPRFLTPPSSFQDACMHITYKHTTQTHKNYF